MIVGSYNRLQFEFAMEQFILPYVGSYAQNENCSVVVLDNCNSHRSSSLNLIRQKGGLCVFLPYVYSTGFSLYNNFVLFQFLPCCCFDLLYSFWNHYRILHWLCLAAILQELIFLFIPQFCTTDYRLMCINSKITTKLHSAKFFIIYRSYYVQFPLL